MKTLLIMPLVVATFFAVVTAGLAACGVRIDLSEPLAAGIVSTGAGILGLVPMLAGRQKDPLAAIQLSLAGTVLHLIGAVGLAGVALATHRVTMRLPFVGWLMAGYWVSLITLIWQLRHLLTTSNDVAKVQQS